jgi:hypothetical protein
MNDPFPGIGLSTFWPPHYPIREQPAEYIDGIGWVQDGSHRCVKRPYYHFVWPKDKRGGKWRRFRDIMTGKGPDIHLTISAKKRDYMYHRPHRDAWANHRNLDDRGPDCALGDAPWTRSKREYPNLAYDYRTRRYCRHNIHMWTDAHWPDRKKGFYDYPNSLRDCWGEWWQYAEI